MDFIPGYISASQVTASVIYPEDDYLGQFIRELDYKLALAELALLTPEERAEVQRYADHLHYDQYHNPETKWPGIYACHMYPWDPRAIPS